MTSIYILTISLEISNINLSPVFGCDNIGFVHRLYIANTLILA